MNPRIAVTVDMVATGTDVKPIEIVMFMRVVKSRQLYEQMKGRGVRVVSRDELLKVTPDAPYKDRFVLVDCVGITKTPMQDTRPLEKKPGVSFGKLLDHVKRGGVQPDMCSSLASRMTRLDRRCSDEERERIQQTGGVSLAELSAGIVDALDPDVQIEAARRLHELQPGQQPSARQVQQSARELMRQALAPLRQQGALRMLLVDLKKLHEQLIDNVSIDTLLYAGPAEVDAEQARELVTSFRAYLDEHKDEIAALQLFYAQPYSQRLRYSDIEALARQIEAPPRHWTRERLWNAYRQLDESRVRGASGKRLLTDIVSLVRFALEQEDELVPHAGRVHERFDNWLAQQENRGRVFDDEQRAWLAMMRDHIAESLDIEMDDFDYTPFAEQGGLGRAVQVFGGELGTVLREINEVLAA